jgi:transcriptional regulator with XRE-family HTH domain
MSTPKKKEATVYAPAHRLANLTPAEALKTLRQLQEMSQKDLAEASGIEQSAISAMEHGRVAIGEVRARKLGRALRVHPAVILFSDVGSDASEFREEEYQPFERIASKRRVAAKRRPKPHIKSRPKPHIKMHVA